MGRCGVSDHAWICSFEAASARKGLQRQDNAWKESLSEMEAISRGSRLVIMRPQLAINKPTCGLLNTWV